MLHQHRHQSSRRLYPPTTYRNIHKNRKKVQIQKQGSTIPVGSIRKRCNQNALILL